MRKKALKKVMIFTLVIVQILLFLACKKEITATNEVSNSIVPNNEKLTGDYNLDFTVMHNFVIDSIFAEENPFFFVKNNSFDISGDNAKKFIKISCVCLNKTTVNDLDLLLSAVLQYVAVNAAEQDFRFSISTKDSEGTCYDFGTVFNTYDLVLDCKKEDGSILRNDNIKKGEAIPIDPRYWISE